MNKDWRKSAGLCAVGGLLVGAASVQFGVPTAVAVLLAALVALAVNILVES